ncbi:aldo/keto reductase [uncultured Nocardioides sp.]|uniref:aldo/keto reductase n=1 Tax=uncultured Nocardioides sp. TaxID=198441 RepID=UPI002626EF40|nr:aldo/keto reductase [uncultured Nocardioides sp.]
MVNLGSSDLDVRPLALGANPFGWTIDEAASHRVLDAFVDGGGNFVDTSDSYGDGNGESESFIGSWLERTGRRDDVVLATKIGSSRMRPGLAADNVAAGVEESLRRLRTDHLDLLWAHFDDTDTPLGETLAAFQALVDAGSVREVGISNYSPARIREWFGLVQANGWRAPVALQPEYSLLRRADYEAERLELAREHDLGVVPYWVLASGLLTGKYTSREDVTGPRQRLVAGYAEDDAAFDVVAAVREVAEAHGVEPASVALAWVRDREGVVAPIASASRPEQVDALLASTTLTLTEEETARLTAASDTVGR